MKSEREFIDSVFAKYEIQKRKSEKNLKRTKTICFYSGLAACLCVVMLGYAGKTFLYSSRDVSTSEEIAVQNNVAVNDSNGTSGVAAYEDGDDANDGYSAKKFVADADNDSIDSGNENGAVLMMRVPNFSAMSMCTAASLDSNYVIFEESGFQVGFSIGKAAEIIENDGKNEIVSDGKTVGFVFSDTLPDLKTEKDIYNDDNISCTLCTYNDEKMYGITVSGDHNVLILLYVSDFAEDELEAIAYSVEVN